MNKYTDILYCRCSGGQELDEVDTNFLYDQVLKISSNASTSSQASLRVNVVTDLCHWASKERDRLGKNLKLGDSIFLISSCSKRAVVSLLNYAGIPVSEEEIKKFVNYRNISNSVIVAQVKAVIDDADSFAFNNFVLDYEPANLAWFPVIDKERCVQCRQCENFCLFGTYKFIDGNVTVTNPSKCKPYCPACSKICPQSAVIFPKHDSPVTNGAELRTEEPADKTISKMSGPELMSFLHDRSSIVDKAKDLGIPDSVIKSMTPDQLDKIISDRK